MTRRLVLAATLVLALAPRSFAGGTWHKSIAPAQKAAKANNQLILVDMFAEWCGWCHRFEQEVFPAEAFQNATEDVVLLRLNTEDQGEGTKLARQYQVTSLPTFLVLAPDLSLAGVIRGYSPAPQFVQMLAETRTKYTSFLKREQNEANMVKDFPGRLELAKEYVTRSAYPKAEVRLKKLTSEKGVPGSIRDEAFYQLAVAYTMQNKLDDAAKTIKALNAISTRGSAVEQSQLLMGQIYLQQGNLKGAVNQLKYFKKTYPNSLLMATVNQVLPDIEKRLAEK